MLYVYLEQRANCLEQPLRVLEIGPEPYSSWLRKRFSAAVYVTLDLESGLARCRGDITALPLRDGSFDLIICYHVLEHVPDDRGAMRELLRVLALEGSALLHVPIDRDVTLEDAAATEPEERIRLFGQHDHVRAYGRDFVSRLEESGFRVHVDEFAATLPDETVRRYGLLRDDIVYVATVK